MLLHVSLFLYQRSWPTWNVSCLQDRDAKRRKSARKDQDGGHICSQCDKTFSSRGSLNQHTQLHTGQFRYYCTVCRKGFNAPTNFKQHMRAHEGLRYHCEYCSKPFASQQNLRNHLSVHTGNYRFHCETCQQGFNDKNKFSLHLANCVKH